MGKWSLVFGYFLPDIRHLTALAAGASKLRFPPFMLLAYTGAFIWSMTFILLGYFLGEEWARVSQKIHFYSVAAVGVFVALALFYAFRQKRKGATSSR